jgi:hypothetical protein
MDKSKLIVIIFAIIIGVVAVALYNVHRISSGIGMIISGILFFVSIFVK